MLFDDVTGKREAQARTSRLGREEWIEYVGHLLRCDTDACIADLDQNAFAVPYHRADLNASTPTPGSTKGLDRIGQEIDQHPLNLNSIRDNRRECLVQRKHKQNSVRGELIGQQRCGFAHKVVDVETAL